MCKLAIGSRLLAESDEDGLNNAVERDLGLPAYASHDVFTRSCDNANLRRNCAASDRAGTRVTLSNFHGKEGSTVRVPQRAL
jgi:hypothetical protein